MGWDNQFVIGRSRIDNLLMGVCANKLSNCSLLDSSFVTNNIHFEHSTHLQREHRLSKEDTLWNDIQFSRHSIVRGRLCDATTRRVLRKNRGYTLAKTEDRCSHVPLYVFLSQHAVNNTLLLMIVDSGYIDLWRNSYYSGHLAEYPNLIVFCLDQQSYAVGVERRVDGRLSTRRCPCSW